MVTQAAAAAAAAATAAALGNQSLVSSAQLGSGLGSGNGSLTASSINNIMNGVPINAMSNYQRSLITHQLNNNHYPSSASNHVGLNAVNSYVVNASGINKMRSPYNYTDMLNMNGSSSSVAASMGLSANGLSRLGIESSPYMVQSMNMSLNSINNNNLERRVGAYTMEERRIKIEKFRERKRQRIWRKQIKYDCRKRLADTRPRLVVLLWSMMCMCAFVYEVMVLVIIG
jgi:hypothetical protein